MTLPIANTFASKFCLELKVMITKWYPYYKIHENRAVVVGEASWGGGVNKMYPGGRTNADGNTNKEQKTHLPDRGRSHHSVPKENKRHC